MLPCDGCQQNKHTLHLVSLFRFSITHTINQNPNISKSHSAICEIMITILHTVVTQSTHTGTFRLYRFCFVLFFVLLPRPPSSFPSLMCPSQIIFPTFLNPLSYFLMWASPSYFFPAVSLGSSCGMTADWSQSASSKHCQQSLHFFMVHNGNISPVFVLTSTVKDP